MKLKLFLSLLFASLCAAVALFARKDSPQSSPARGALVRAIPVAYSDASIPIRAVGVLARKVEADLSFKVGGIVEVVAVRAGDRVVRGQVLARLRTEEIDAQVEQARSALAKAERDRARLETLLANRVATLENLQDARTAAEVAGAALRIAEFNRQYAVIIAPDHGQILRRRGEPGELIAPGQAVVGFSSEAEGWLLRAGLADRELAQLKLGDRVEVVVGDGPPVAGRLAHIAEAADATTRTTPVEIVLEAVSEQARSGRIAVATLWPARVSSRPVVPASALIEGAGLAGSLYVVDDGAAVARRIAVEIEAMHGEQVFLRSALPRAARLVVSGAEYLRDGMAVEVAQ